MIKNYRIIFLIFSIVIIVSCSPLEKVEQPSINDNIILDQNNILGQTFVARYNGLNGFHIYLIPDASTTTTIKLTVTNGRDYESVIRQSTIELAEGSPPGYYKFIFPSISDSTKEYYYSFMELEGTGSVQVAFSGGENYINGALYKNHLPKDAQVTFNLSYEPIHATLGIIKEGFIWILWLFFGIILYLFPGWGILGLLWKGWGNYHWGVKLGLSSGFSLAVYPVLFLWTNALGLKVGLFISWISPLLGFILFAGIIKKTYREDKFP